MFDRHPSLYSIVWCGLFAGLLLISGCDKVEEIAQQVGDEAEKAMDEIEKELDEGLGEETGDGASNAADSSGAGDTTTSGQQTPKTTPPPQKLTPEQVVAAFQDKPPAKVTDDDLARLGELEEGFELLTEVVVDRSEVTAGGLAHLEKFPLLRLSVEDIGLALDGAEAIAKIQTLEGIRINNNPDFNDECLKLVCALPNLKRLNLSSTGITDAGLAHLAAAEGLEELYLNELKITGSELPALAALHTLWINSTLFGEGGMANVGRLANLEDLHAFRAQIDDRGLLPLKRCPKLRILILAENREITGEGFAKLKGLRNLEEVSFFRCNNVTRHALNTLSLCEGLKLLNVQSTMITAGDTTKLKNNFCPEVVIKR